MKSIVALIVLCGTVALAQRSPYAGFRPAGDLTRASPPNTGNRNNLGSDQNQNVPYQVRNDIPHYNYLQGLPQERQPYWLLNQQHIQNHLSQPGSFGSPYAQRSHFAGRR